MSERRDLYLELCEVVIRYLRDARDDHVRIPLDTRLTIDVGKLSEFLERHGKSSALCRNRMWVRAALGCDDFVQDVCAESAGSPVGRRG